MEPALIPNPTSRHAVIAPSQTRVQVVRALRAGAWVGMALLLAASVALLAQAEVRFQDRKTGLNHTLKRTALVPELPANGFLRWENFLVGPVTPRDLDRNALPQSRFDALNGPLSDEKTLRSLESDFSDWIYRAVEVVVRANETLKVYAGPDVDDDEFTRMCQEAAAREAAKEADKLEGQWQRKIDSVQKKLVSEERELEDDKAEHSRRKMEEAATHAETLFSLFSKRRRSVSSSMTKRRMTARAAEDVKESEEEIERLKKELDDLEDEMKQAMDDLEEKWTAIVDDVTEIRISPYKKDIAVEMFGVAWAPHHLVQVDGRFRYLPGFAPAAV